MSLPTRSLERNGPQVPAVGVGLMSLGNMHGFASALDDKVAFLEPAYSIGARSWDTADLYFDSDHTVREWVKKLGNLNNIFLATKFAIQYDVATGTQITCSNP
ncbi:Aldo/keto reductase [Penicillium digitatum]|jgi:aryl-alcohol dehydrogenase-like predicted oxidoreductase|uniref:NADP-dependent oxidoreductase domain-containing protein n=3 Tax=Penicillium digitatum TaxID=36651 RepID=K9G3N8_PEND2|nr:hypothetical protein PDIP_15590 [Penicillium digitatum Pd1]EKV15964.1 hypothetical protein PDIG_23190 [Penicillium digitatum PHI26]EKV20475.1 hypothetical protein PDIP_15590 [Penicillium digitatum Pd1]QQK39925.1 Aldo/keto reductase [Penicillium digitatum]